VRDLSLSDLYLAPSSVLLLRFEDAAHPDQARALNGKSRTIRVTCILLICTYVSASTAPAPLASEMLAQAIELPATPAAASASTSSTPGNLGSGLDSVAADLKNGLNNLEKKMPKWMKMGLSASFFYLLSLFSYCSLIFL
jgi:tether containing UBX domain for GLUT4